MMFTYPNSVKVQNESYNFVFERRLKNVLDLKNVSSHFLATRCWPRQLQDTREETYY